MTLAGGIVVVKQQVEIQLQVLDEGGLPFGVPFLEQCCVEPPGPNVSLLSGMGLRTTFWSGMSPGHQGHLAMATSANGLIRVLN